MKNLVQRVEYFAALSGLWLIRHLPLPCLHGFARFIAAVMYLLPFCRRIATANVRVAFPELPDSEVKRIVKASFGNAMRNMLEFFWYSGDPQRFTRCCSQCVEHVKELQRRVAAGERIIFVNPHLGSWEASGMSVPFYCGLEMVAVAKPLKNPYLNQLLNGKNRESFKGVEIVLSRGAIRALIKALVAGKNVGLLIDQNTRVRDGGVWVNFFGVPVPSSASPVVLKRFLDSKNIPSVVVFAACCRDENGVMMGKIEHLPKPFAEYTDDREIIQDLFKISERWIRRYPEQYLWLYKRFNYISPEATPEERARYPYYSIVPEPKFYRKVSGKPLE